MASQAIPTFDEFVAQTEPQEHVSVKVTYPGIPDSGTIPTFDEFEQKEVRPGLLHEFGAATLDQLIGMAKGAGSTAFGVGSLLRKYIPGLAWAGNKISDLTLGHHITEEEFANGRKALGLEPTNFAQKVGFGAEQLGEFFAPGALITKGQKIANAGARFAEAFPKLVKAAPAAEYGARGVLEAAPAVAIAKAQGQEDTRGVAAFALAGPTFGKLLNKTRVSKAATATAKGVTGLVSKTIAEKIPEVPQSPRQMMWRALKPYVRNRDFDKALDNAMPEIYEQARMTGKTVENVDDFLKLLKDTKKRIWAPYEKFLKETDATINGADIAAAIRSSVTPRQAAKNPTEVKAINAWAQKYWDKGKMKLAEAEDWLQNVNAEIQSYYNKYPGARHAALEADPAMAASVKEAEALRAAINKVIEKTHPKVKQVYGGLTNLEQEAYRRVNVSKRLAPESLTEQMANVHAAGQFIEGALSGHPLSSAIAIGKGFAYRKAAQVIKERNTSDYLIKKAFQDFGDYVEQAKRAHRIPTAVVATTQESKAPKTSAKITEPAPAANFMAPRPPTPTPSTPPPTVPAPPEILSGKVKPTDLIEKFEPEVQQTINDSVNMRVQEIRDIFSEGTGALSGKAKDIGAYEMNAAARANLKHSDTGFGHIRVKSAAITPEVADFPEAPGRIADAIAKDKNNPLYLRVKAAVKEDVLERYGEQIEAQQASILERKAAGEATLSGKTPKKKGKGKRKDYSEVPF